MATMGGVPLSSDPQPYMDFAISGNPGWGMSPSTTYYLPFTSITMPWPGSLFVSIEWCLYWNNRQQVNLSPYSSPGCTGWSNWSDIEEATSRCDVTLFCNQSWVGLAQGTVVNIGVATTIGGGGSPVWSDAWIVHARGYKT